MTATPIKFCLRPILTGLLVWTLAVMLALQTVYATALTASGGCAAEIRSCADNNAALFCCPDCKTTVAQSLPCEIDGCNSVPALIPIAVVTSEPLTEIWFNQPSQFPQSGFCEPDPRPPRIPDSLTGGGCGQP